MKSLRLVAILWSVTFGVAVGSVSDYSSDVAVGYLSQNRKFLAYVTGPKEENAATVQVFEVKDPNIVIETLCGRYSDSFFNRNFVTSWSKNKRTKLIWKAVLNNKEYPVDTFVSNNGRYVVTLDDWPNVGYGDNVIVFYNENGQITKYSLETAVPLPESYDPHAKDELFPHYDTSRWWRDGIEFFQNIGGQHYFCIWLDWNSCWLVWKAATGESVEPDEKLIEQLNKHARFEFLEQLKNKQCSPEAFNFLCRLKLAEDRLLLENLLADEDFGTEATWCEKKSLIQRTLEKIYIYVDRDGPWELEYYRAESMIRKSADEALARWDGKIAAKLRLDRSHPYYYLGNVVGKVYLPRKPKGYWGLWVYLIPTQVPKEQWDEKRPVHYLHAESEFDSHHKVGRLVPFVFGGVIPGKYWVKAVWDKEKPFAEGNSKFYRPEKSDYESLASPVIEAKAGKRTDAGTIKCTHKVKGK